MKKLIGYFLLGIFIIAFLFAINSGTVIARVPNINEGRHTVVATTSTAIVGLRESRVNLVLVNKDADNVVYRSTYSFNWNERSTKKYIDNNRGRLTDNGYDCWKSTIWVLSTNGGEIVDYYEKW